MYLAYVASIAFAYAGATAAATVVLVARVRSRRQEKVLQTINRGRIDRPLQQPDAMAA